MKINEELQTLKIWVENSDELQKHLNNAIRDMKTLPSFSDTIQAFVDHVKQLGFITWVKNRIKDGFNPIDLCFSAALYTQVAFTEEDVRITYMELYWMLVNEAINEHSIRK